MDIYEVTNAAYAECVAADACSAPSASSSDTRSSYYGIATYNNYPVIYVSWSQASEYCAWRGGSLPTEAQWEYAARGGLAGMDYPWGNESPVCTTGVSNGANYSDCSGSDTVSVGSYAPNGYGLYDMAGNVWEWVNDWYSGGYYSVSPGSNPPGPDTGTVKVLRGGAWYDYDGKLRVAYRYDDYLPTVQSYFIGFRCVASPGR